MMQFSPGKQAYGKAFSSSPDLPAMLEPILDKLSDGVIVTGRDGGIVLMNSTAARMFGTVARGASPSDWPERLGLYSSDRVTPFPAGEVPLARAMRGESVSEVEMFVSNAAVPNGLWISASAAPLTGDHSQLLGAIVTLRDISSSKRAEEALRRERDWASAVIETVASLVIVLDRSGRVISFNGACEEATGYTFDEVHGRPFWEFLLIPEEVESVKAVFAELQAGHFPNQHENYWVAKDGSRRLIAWSNTCLLDAHGQVEYVLATGTDVTDRRRVEDDLRQTAGTLRAVIDTSPLAIVAMELEGTVKSWNRAAERMFGWTEQEVIGKKFPIVPDDDEEFFRHNQERLQHGETIAGVERQRRRKDGTTIDVALWNSPQRDASGRVIGAISVIADMSERKRLEDQFRQSQKMEAVGRLAGGVAHDFNNLLTVIAGYTQMLLDELEPDDLKRDYVEEIVHASESATGLTNQLLAFSRRQIVSPQVLELNTLIAGMDKMLHRLIGEDIQLVMSLAPKLPKVKVDAGQFQQVLMNLVVNARDAMPDGGAITIETSTTTVGENHPDGVPPGPYVQLSVTDTGRGMTEDVRRRIFEPFFTTKGRGKGTGLGLSTVYGIVKQAGGEVSVASEPGSGSVFRIFLPSIEEAVAAGVETPGAVERKTGIETVLLIEDEAGLRKLIRDLLMNHGYTVLEAADCRGALEFCEAYAGPIHLVLTDVVLPGMSGRDLADRARALRPKLRILYMSGYTDHSVLPGLDSETPFLQKPFVPETLLAKIREVLDRS